MEVVNLIIDGHLITFHKIPKFKFIQTQYISLFYSQGYKQYLTPISLSFDYFQYL